MQSAEVTNLHYLIPPNPSQYPSHLNNTSTMQFYPFTNNPLLNLQAPNSQPQDFNIPQYSSFSSNNSTSDEAEDQQQQGLINERKQRRMISNRESARRSRMRKQKHLYELWSQAIWLRNENHQLIDKLNQVSESHDRVLQENTQLKEEASELRQMITDQLQLSTSPYPFLRELDQDVPCNTEYLRAESSIDSIIINSMDLLGEGDKF